MPSTSAKQAKFMRAIANSPKFAKKVGVPQSVGKDFEMADKKKMKKFGGGGWSGRGSVTVPLDEPKPAARRGSGPTAAEREEARRQNESLKKAKVTKQEAKVIGSANRSEGPGYKKGGKVKKYAAGSQVGASRGAQAGKPVSPGGLSTSDPRLRTQTVKPVSPGGLSTSDPRLRTQTVKPVSPGNDIRKPVGVTTLPQATDPRRPPVQPLSTAGTPPPAPTQSQMQSQMGSTGRPTVGAINQVAGTPMKKGGKVMKKATKAGKAMVKKSADTMGRAMKMNKGGKCYAKGGSIDGIAKKGKTRGKMC